MISVMTLDLLKEPGGTEEKRVIFSLISFFYSFKGVCSYFSWERKFNDFVIIFEVTKKVETKVS